MKESSQITVFFGEINNDNFYDYHVASIDFLDTSDHHHFIYYSMNNSLKEKFSSKNLSNNSLITFSKEKNSESLKFFEYTFEFTDFENLQKFVIFNSVENFYEIDTFYLDKIEKINSNFIILFIDSLDSDNENNTKILNFYKNKLKNYSFIENLKPLICIFTEEICKILAKEVQVSNAPAIRILNYFDISTTGEKKNESHSHFFDFEEEINEESLDKFINNFKQNNLKMKKILHIESFYDEEEEEEENLKYDL